MRVTISLQLDTMDTTIFPSHAAELLALEWRKRLKPKYPRFESYVQSLKGASVFEPKELEYMACIEVTPCTKDMVLVLPMFRLGEFDTPTKKYYQCCECTDSSGNLKDHLMKKHDMSILEFFDDQKRLQCGYVSCSETKVYYPDDHIIAHKDKIRYRDLQNDDLSGDDSSSGSDDCDDPIDDQPGLVVQSNVPQLGVVPSIILPGPSRSVRHQEFECKKCPYVFQKEEHYRAHNDKVHKKSGHICCYCQKEFASLDLRKTHIYKFHKTKSRAAHDDESEARPFHASRKGKIYNGRLDCERCFELSGDKERLKIHKKAIHKPKFYKCKEPDCIRKFSDGHLLAAHRAQIHQIIGEVAERVAIVNL